MLVDQFFDVGNLTFYSMTKLSDLTYILLGIGDAQVLIMSE